MSWLEFNRRVLEEASNHNHPLLEQVRFLSISANNLDEFFMVRVAGLRGQMRAGLTEPSEDGLRRPSSWSAIATRVAVLVAAQQRRWRELREELETAGIVIVDARICRKREMEWLQDHFLLHVFPVLTPLAVDPAHPFPFIPNLGFTWRSNSPHRRRTPPMSALVRFPNRVERFMQPARSAGGGRAALHDAGQTIVAFSRRLFPGYRGARPGHLPGHPRQRPRSRGRGRGSRALLRDAR